MCGGWEAREEAGVRVQAGRGEAGCTLGSGNRKEGRLLFSFGQRLSPRSPVS